MGVIKLGKRAIVGIIGRPAANRLSAPYHDFLAVRRTREMLERLPSHGLSVNIGCGPNARPGWVNLDMARGAGIDVVWDLRKGLPFRSESCTAIFGEHVIEHLSKADAETLVRDCHRSLEIDGVLRLSTPEAGRFFRSYAADGDFLRHSGFGAPAETAMDRINQMMREFGQHLWSYDTESLSLLLKKAGFSRVVEKLCGESEHPLMKGVDDPTRAFESVYFDAIK